MTIRVVLDLGRFEPLLLRLVTVLEWQMGKSQDEIAAALLRPVRRIEALGKMQ